MTAASPEASRQRVLVADSIGKSISLRVIRDGRVITLAATPLELGVTRF